MNKTKFKQNINCPICQHVEQSQSDIGRHLSTTHLSAEGQAKSNSELFRVSGNNIFSTTFNLDPQSMRGKLMEALTYYNKAVSTSWTVDDKCSALKNVAVVHGKQISLLSDLLNRAEMVYHVKELISAVNQATDIQQLCPTRTVGWLTDLLESKSYLIGEFITYMVETVVLKERIYELDKLLRSANYSETNAVNISERITFQLNIATWTTNLAIVHQNKGEFKKARYMLGEFHFPFEECSKLIRKAENVESDSEKKIISQSINLSNVSARNIDASDDYHRALKVNEAQYALQKANDLFDVVVYKEESLNLDMAWEMADLFMVAISSHDGNDLETEAEACARLGETYEKVIKYEYHRSHALYRQTIILGEALKPKDVTKTGWYLKATEGMRKWQEKILREEEQKWSTKREKHKAEVEEDLQKICKASLDKTDKKLDSMVGFLKFIGTNYIPKQGTLDLPPADLLKDRIKSTLRRAIGIYHPDKQDEKKHGIPWKIICDEITKYLNRFYESIKG